MRRRLALADQVERRFHMMRKGRGGFETEHGSRPFDGVQGPEGGVDQIGIAGIAVEIQERRFKLRQQFLRFLLEDIDRICRRAHSPRTFLATATSCSG